MVHFAWHSPEVRAAPQAIARDMPSNVAYELDGEIAWRREALADAEGHQGNFDADARAWYASTSAELRRLEMKRFGTTNRQCRAIPCACTRPRSGSHGDLDADRRGPWAPDFRQLARGDPDRKGRGRALGSGSCPPPAQAPAPIGAHHMEKHLSDGFDHWALSCISRLQGRQIRTAEAHLHYQTFCAPNDYLAPLAVQEFGRRLRGMADGHSRHRRPPFERHRV